MPATTITSRKDQDDTTHCHDFDRCYFRLIIPHILGYTLEAVMTQIESKTTVSRPRRHYLMHRYLILIVAVSAMAILFRLANLPRAANANSSLASTQQGNTRTTLLKDLQEGASGYITLADIQTHPLLNVYIAEDTEVSPTLTTRHVVRITLSDHMIVLDPPSVQQALRYVTWGPIKDAERRIMTSPQWWPTSVQPNQPGAGQ